MSLVPTDPKYMSTVPHTSSELSRSSRVSRSSSHSSHSSQLSRSNQHQSDFQEYFVVSTREITKDPGNDLVNVKQKRATYKIRGDQPVVATEQSVEGQVREKNLAKYFSDLSLYKL